jgi:Domain of unknown function (DUF4439)
VPRPDDRLRPARRIGRRGLLAAALLPLAALPGCGPIGLGQPEAYTPPPPGIDDLYRNDLLALLDRAIAGAEAIVAAAGGSSSDPDLSTAVDALVTALPIQRDALLTGAQYEREQEASEDPSPDRTTAPPPEDAPRDAAGLVAVLIELRDLCADAARQVSGSLARPVAAIGAHTAFSARRFQLAADAGEITPLRPAEEIEPTREVPETDPPSIGAEADYHAMIEQAQQEEWYAGYVHEVLAARSEGTDRDEHLALSERHRTRAGSLAAIAEEDGAPVVLRQAVYPLPGGVPDDRMAGELPTLLAQGLVVDHVALVGAAPFARRPLSIVAAMEEAEVLVGRAAGMDPLPSLEPDDPPAGDGG